MSNPADPWLWGRWSTPAPSFPVGSSCLRTPSPSAILFGSTADQAGELADAIAAVGFVGRAFGADARWEDRVARYPQACEVRSAEFQTHLEDSIVDHLA